MTTMTAPRQHVPSSPEVGTSYPRQVRKSRRFKDEKERPTHQRQQKRLSKPEAAESESPKPREAVYEAKPMHVPGGLPELINMALNHRRKGQEQIVYEELKEAGAVCLDVSGKCGMFTLKAGMIVLAAPFLIVGAFMEGAIVCGPSR